MLLESARRRSTNEFLESASSASDFSDLSLRLNTRCQRRSEKKQGNSLGGFNVERLLEEHSRRHVVSESDAGCLLCHVLVHKFSLQVTQGIICKKLVWNLTRTCKITWIQLRKWIGFGAVFLESP